MNNGVGFHFLLQGIFLTPGSNSQLCISYINGHIPYLCAPREKHAHF